MTSLTKNNEYAITITYKCNWNCEYCAVKNSIDWKENVTREDVLKKISCIADNSIVTLFGGEPGMLSKTELIEYINLLKEKNCILKLETNGLFIKRYPDLLSNFIEITYHCSMDLDITDEIIKCDNLNIKYMLIVHDFNIEKLEKFLITNKTPEKFYIVEATYPHEKTGPTLSTINKNKLIVRYANRMTKQSIQRLLHGFDFDNIIFLT
jgi:organic radical activating enzyme